LMRIYLTWVGGDVKKVKCSASALLAPEFRSFR
jgi:hypothetical protein